MINQDQVAAQLTNRPSNLDKINPNNYSPSLALQELVVG